ncbi:unnamed protein product [Amoebophrya sp. A25]|nr:unnamed protein product [Amoebophrya sp. A25]|eukprot:GSA25T00004988001.1
MASIFARCFSAKEFTQILVIGLEGVGKSTLLHRLKVPQWRSEKLIPALSDLRQYRLYSPEEYQKILDERKEGGGRNTDPVIEYTSYDGAPKVAVLKDPGYNYETFYDFGLWDIPGIVSDVLPSLWALFYRAVKYSAVFYVVSSTDADRLTTCRKHIFSLMNEEELRDSALVILINSRRENPYDVARDAFYYELELHKLDPTKVRKFAFDFSAIKGQKDPNFLQVLDFVRNREKK